MSTNDMSAACATEKLVHDAAAPDGGLLAARVGAEAGRVADAEALLLVGRGGVGPDEVEAEREGRPRGGDGARDGADAREDVGLGVRHEVAREAAVHAEDAPVYDGREGQQRERGVGGRGDAQRRVLAAVLLAELREERLGVVKVRVHVHARELVVAAQQKDLLGVQDLHREQPQDRLEPVAPAVHVVAQKQERRRHKRRRLQQPKRLREAHQVLVVPVDVPNHVQRRLQLQQRRVRRQHRLHQIEQLKHCFHWDRNIIFPSV